MTGSPKVGCSWFAAMAGWEILRANLLVEGTSDVRYFKLADSLHFKNTGNHLLGIDLAVSAVGIKDDGGTYGIMDKFPTITTVSKMDVDHNQRQIYRFIALVDDDNMGRSAIKKISTSRRDIREYESIFRLQRTMPMRAGNAAKLAERSREQNAMFEMDCVIEDLLPIDICNEYIKSNPHHLNPTLVLKNGGHHAKWHPERKAGLLRFAETHAVFEDMVNIISVLKALRSYLALPPEGVNG